jgi:very-short-patch-repair endonuclease
MPIRPWRMPAKKPRQPKKKSPGEEGLVLALRIAKIDGYVREYVFAPPRKWRFDFAFVDEKLAVEIEGGIWIKGAHNRGAHFESDTEKYNEAAILGWRVLRVSTEQVTKTGQALDWIVRALK